MQDSLARTVHLHLLPPGYLVYPQRIEKRSKAARHWLANVFVDAIGQQRASSLLLQLCPRIERPVQQPAQEDCCIPAVWPGYVLFERHKRRGERIQGVALRRCCLTGKEVKARRSGRGEKAAEDG